jgi:hypothetical protein
MTVKTIVTYNPLPGINLHDIIVKAAEMEAAGKTDFTDGSIEFPNGENNPPVITTRSWVDEVAAQEWIDYLNSLPITPLSAEIITQ